MRKIGLALLAAGCSPAALAAPSAHWKISETSGSVQVIHGGNSRVAVRKDDVAVGDTIVTGGNGRAVLVRGSEFVMVAPGSRLRMPEQEETSGVTRIFQEVGNAVFMIKKKLNPHFEVKTPYLAAVVKGTTFTVTVNPDGASVQVLEGAVDVATSDGGARELITPGSVALVGAMDRYSLHVDGMAGRRVIQSPAAPAPSESMSPPQAGAKSAVEPAPAIIAAVQAEPVSLAEVTQGLVHGTSGAAPITELAEISTASRAAAESSTSVARAVEIAANLLAGQTARENEAREAEAIRQTAQARTASDQASLEAERAQAALAAAEAQKAREEAARLAAEDASSHAARQASDAAEAAVRAEAEQQARLNASAAAEAAAIQAARNAELAAQAAANEAAAAQDIADEEAREAARVAAEQSARIAAQAAAEAELARQVAAQAAQQATAAAAEKAARDAETAARSADAERAAREAQQAAEAAQRAASERTAREAETAAREAERLAAVAAAQEAQLREEAARQAAQSATSGSRDRWGDLFEKWKAIGDAIKDRIEDSLANKGKGSGR